MILPLNRGVLYNFSITTEQRNTGLLHFWCHQGICLHLLVRKHRIKYPLALSDRNKSCVFQVQATKQKIKNNKLACLFFDLFLFVSGSYYIYLHFIYHLEPLKTFQLLLRTAMSVSSHLYICAVYVQCVLVYVRKKADSEP